MKSRLDDYKLNVLLFSLQYVYGFDCNPGGIYLNPLTFINPSDII